MQIHRSLRVESFLALCLLIAAVGVGEAMELIDTDVDDMGIGTVSDREARVRGSRVPRHVHARYQQVTKVLQISIFDLRQQRRCRV